MNEILDIYTYLCKTEGITWRHMNVRVTIYSLHLTPMSASLWIRVATTKCVLIEIEKMIAKERFSTVPVYIDLTRPRKVRRVVTIRRVPVSESFFRELLRTLPSLTRVLVIMCNS